MLVPGQFKKTGQRTTSHSVGFQKSRRRATMEMRLCDRVVNSMTCCMMPFSFTCVVLFCISSSGSEPAICPDSVDVNQQLTAPVSGWTTVIDDTPHRLAGITFLRWAATTESLVDLRPKNTGRRKIATWHFRPRADRQIWVGCSYASAAIALTKALPPSTKTCSVTYNPGQSIAGLPVIEKIVCK
jgi:hypothetical protein